jgi:hypothetical protein
MRSAECGVRNSKTYVRAGLVSAPIPHPPLNTEH